MILKHLNLIGAVVYLLAMLIWVSTFVGTETEPSTITWWIVPKVAVVIGIPLLFGWSAGREWERKR